jgi:hypothetical protein
MAKDCTDGCYLDGTRSHKKGGIKSELENSNKTVEMESEEYVVCKKAASDNSVNTYTGTNREIVKKINNSFGGNDKVVRDSDNTIIVESGQVVINKKSMNDPNTYTYTGTNKQILSEINQKGGGVAIYKCGGEVYEDNYKLGGKLFGKKEKEVIEPEKRIIRDGDTVFYKGSKYIVLRQTHDFTDKKYLLKEIDSGVEIVLFEEYLDSENFEKGGEVEKKRNIFYPKMKASNLERILAKPKLKENEIEDLEDFLYLMIYETKNAYDSGLMNKIDVSQKGDVFVPKNKFWITNIKNRIDEFYSERNKIEELNKVSKDQLQGGLADNKTIEDIAKEQNENIEFAREQLKKGIAVEMEHSDNKEIAKEIALDHLSESINYYIELEKMENKLEGGDSENIKENTERKELEGIKKHLESLKSKEKELWNIYSEMTYSDEKNKVSQQREEVKRGINFNEKLLINYKNRVKVLDNFGSLTNIKDDTGVEHLELPDFTNIKADKIIFDVETILSEIEPDYVPYVDEGYFKKKGYIFDSIRISDDKYILSTIDFQFQKEELPKKGEENYYQPLVLVTLDQLVLIIDYYTTKERANLIKEAEERTERQERYYDSLPESKREAHFNQKGFYQSLPVKVKKKIAQADWEALSLIEKEKIYKPFKKYNPKRIKSKLDEGSMWSSFHEMYRLFLNKDAWVINASREPQVNRKSGMGFFANPETVKYWKWFKDFIDYKSKDIASQRADLSESRKAALETSFGESNTSDILKEEFGFLVKRQNGDDIKPFEVDEIRNAWVSVREGLGELKDSFLENKIKISHSGKRLIFASKAVGVFIPEMGTIGVSMKYDDTQFKLTLAHELGHFIDWLIGKSKDKRWSTDDYESVSGRIAFAFRDNMNKPKHLQNDYVNNTKECFARAVEEYYGYKILGEKALLKHSYVELDREYSIFNADDFVSKDKFEQVLLPLLEEFFEEYKDFFKYNTQIDKDMDKDYNKTGYSVGETVSTGLNDNIYEIVGFIDLDKPLQEKAELKPVKMFIAGESVEPFGDNKIVLLSDLEKIDSSDKNESILKELYDIEYKAREKAGFKGGRITDQDNKTIKDYVQYIKEHASKLDTPFSDNVHDALEDINYHSLNIVLSLLGFYKTNRYNDDMYSGVLSIINDIEGRGLKYETNDRATIESNQRFSNVKELNRGEIITKPEDFQGRQKAYSEESVDKIVSEGFDKSNDPIIVWYDKDSDKYIVISGHSRFEASRRLYEAGDKSLQTMPVKEFLGDKEEAVSFAVLESNRASTQEGLISDINAVRKMLKEGYNKSEMTKYVKPQSYLENVIRYTYLNPDGKFIEYLASPSKSSFPYLERNAAWVGDLRKMYGEKITSQHENEMFDYMYLSGASKGLKLNKGQFYNLINSKVMKIDYDKNAPLNLHNMVSVSSVVSPAEEKLKEMREMVDYLQKEIYKKQDLIVRARIENKPELVSKFQQYITDATNRVLEVKEDINKLESEVSKVKNETVRDLFSGISEYDEIQKVEAEYNEMEADKEHKEWEDDAKADLNECNNDLIDFKSRYGKDIIAIDSLIRINGLKYNVVSLDSDKIKLKENFGKHNENKSIVLDYEELVDLFSEGKIDFDNYNLEDLGLFELMIKSKQICIIKENTLKSIKGMANYSVQKISDMSLALNELTEYKEKKEQEIKNFESELKKQSDTNSVNSKYIEQVENENKTLKERIQGNAARLNYKELKEKGYISVEDPEEVLDRIKKYVTFDEVLEINENKTGIRIVPQLSKKEIIEKKIKGLNAALKYGSKENKTIAEKKIKGLKTALKYVKEDEKLEDGGSVDLKEKDMLNSKYYVNFDVLYNKPVIYNAEISTIKSTRHKNYGSVRIKTSYQPLVEYLREKDLYNNMKSKLSRKNAEIILKSFGFQKSEYPLEIEDITEDKRLLNEFSISDDFKESLNLYMEEKY